MLKRIVFCIAALATLALGACNTMAGLGSDVSSAGNKLEREAIEHRRY
jgi:predicted small secreted protein